MDLKENVIDFSKICRICINTDAKLSSLFSTEAANMLIFCDFWEVSKGDGLPDKICEDCNNILLQSYKFKRLCISSKIYLESLLVEPDKSVIIVNEYPSEYPDENISESDQNSDMESDTLTTDTKEDKSKESRECSKCREYCPNEELNQQNGLFLDVDDSSSLKPVCSCSCHLIPDFGNSENFSFSSAAGNNNKFSEIFKCPSCNQKFVYVKDLEIHQSVHSKEGLICNVCHKSYSTMKILKRHVKTHMKAKSHVCKICGNCYPESTALTKHMRRHHLGVPRDKKYSCKECGQRFTDAYYLNVHMRKHTGEKPLKCEYCHKSFYDPRSLKVHNMAHSGIKPHKCSYCGKCYVQSAGLKKHLRVHTKEKTYSCKTCSRQFSQSSALLRHEKSHGEKGDYDYKTVVKVYSVRHDEQPKLTISNQIVKKSEKKRSSI